MVCGDPHLQLRSAAIKNLQLWFVVIQVYSYDLWRSKFTAMVMVIQVYRYGLWQSKFTVVVVMQVYSYGLW
jgi:hypothetical protein